MECLEVRPAGDYGSSGESRQIRLLKTLLSVNLCHFYAKLLKTMMCSSSEVLAEVVCKNFAIFASWGF
jgi:hypothetical protein